ncbi:MAG: hypothetical protein ABIY55_32765 [Kofleriaceae bacterium]
MRPINPEASVGRASRSGIAATVTRSETDPARVVQRRMRNPRSAAQSTHRRDRDAAVPTAQPRAGHHVGAWHTGCTRTDTRRQCRLRM